MKWFFLASCIVGFTLSAFLLCMICLALITRVPGEWLMVVVVLSPFFVLFSWATREMFRAFRRAGQRTARGAASQH